jgi:hypothetical protein
MSFSVGAADAGADGVTRSERDTSAGVLLRAPSLNPARLRRPIARPLRYPSRLLRSLFAWQWPDVRWPGAAGPVGIKYRARGLSSLKSTRRAEAAISGFGFKVSRLSSPPANRRSPSLPKTFRLRSCRRHNQRSGALKVRPRDRIPLATPSS